MIGIWLILGFLLFFAMPLCFPLQIKFSSAPTQVEIKWGFTGFSWVETQSGWLCFGIFFPRPKRRLKKSGNQTKKPKKKTRKRRKKSFQFGWAQMKGLKADPGLRRLWKRIYIFLLQLFGAIKLKQLQVIYGGEDPFLTGCVAGVAAILPTSKKLQLRCDFCRRTQVNLELRVQVWKLFFATGLLILRFPYVHLFRFYKTYFK